MGVPLRRILRVFYPGRFFARKAKKNGASFNWRRFTSILFGALLLVKVALFLFYYNTFLSLQYDVEEARAQIDTQLQRRKNIILNLSVMVMDYAEHEKAIFKHAADTRREMMRPELRRSRPEGPVDAPAASPGPGAKTLPPGAPGGLDALLAKVFAIAERYPEIRLSENFQHFMEALVDAENKIAEERMRYNRRANEMSTMLGKFPGFVFARLYGFEAPPFFEPEDAARKPPEVAY